MQTIADTFSELALQLLTINDNTESKFLQFLECSQSIALKNKECTQEVCRLQAELLQAKREICSLQMKLNNAKELLDLEKNRRLFIEKLKFELETQISSVMDMLGQGQINEAKEKLQTLSNSLNITDGRRLDPKDVLSPQNCLSTINEHYDSFESVDTASDIDLTGEELDMAKTRSGRVFRPSTSMHKTNNRKRKSSGNANESIKKQTIYEMDNENVNIQSTPEMQKKTIIVMKSTPLLTPLKTVISPICPFSASRANSRQHSFTSKTIYWNDSCQPCGKRIKFGKTAFKCKDCRITCHPYCRGLAPLPCIAVSVTPANKGSQDLVSDFAPSIPPLVPAIVVHCTNEIEKRGLSEVGVYRVPGSEKDVKDLKEKFMKAKGVPNLSQVDVHVIAGALKDFLLSLREPLVTFALWKKFINAVEKEDKMASMMALYQTIGELPPANRDTLAWMICHLQKVGLSPECKMPIYNLSRVFGPTIIGYSSRQPCAVTILAETSLQQKVLKALLEVSPDYWCAYLTTADDRMEEAMQFNSTPEMARSSINVRRRSILVKTPLADRYSDKK